MTRTLTMLAAGALALCAGTASAATVTFDFAAGGTTSFVNKLNFTTGDVKLALTGKLYDLKGDTVKADTSRGIKVKSSETYGLASQFNCKAGLCDDNFRTDGSQFNEMLMFKFNRKVSIDAITFNDRLVDGSDSFDFALGSTRQFSDTVTESYSVAGGFQGFSFGIGASADDSRFRVTSITVTYDDTTTVPVPAGGLMALGGLGALAALRRKAKRA